MSNNALATLRYVTLRYVTLRYLSFKLFSLFYCKNLFTKSIYILSVLCGYFNFGSLSEEIKNFRFVINKLQGVIYE